MKIKLTKVILFIAIIFTLSYSKPAQAQWETFDFPTEFSTLMDTIGNWGSWFLDIAGLANSALGSHAILVQKMLALTAVQQGTALLIGDGNDGTIIRDFNNYLYVSPQQTAMAQMNSFFNTVSRGRLSTLNYEGIGPNYDAYLVSQARMAIAGQPFSTNLQDIVTDPTQMFAGGNMKGIMTYMQCANNVACYTLTSTAQYNSEFAKAQDLARTANVNGFIPKMVNGRVVQPAALAQNALLQIDQLGTQILMSAESKDPKSTQANADAIAQIWIGAGISATSRLTNYGISDKAGQDAIRNKNDQFPFSLGYSAKGGLGISAGGVTATTGIGAIASQLQIGNTCASFYGTVTPAGATVDISGRKYDCATKTVTSGAAPSVKTTSP